MKTIYEKIGDERLKKLIHRFYDLIFSESEIRHLFQNSSKEDIMDKQYCFLTQFLGGPPLYTEKYGQPKMRQRHLPHEITVEAKDEWLRCMKDAIDSMEFEDGLGDALYHCFPQVANHMVNS